MRKGFRVFVLVLIVSLCVSILLTGCSRDGSINDKDNKEEHNVDLARNIEEAGSVLGAGKYVEGEERTISATTNSGYTWLGWYDGETKVSTGNELTYTFTMPAYNKTYEARWGDYQRINASGELDTNGEYILFGEYPQTIQASEVTVGSTTDSRGYYLGDDGYYYAMVTATPFGSGYTFSTGTTVTEGTVYYFKVEPIKWRILSESTGNALILCERIITNIRYNEYYIGTNEDGYYPNNYMNSEIRAWLNNEFYNNAFNSLQQALIQTTVVDNSASSTGYDPNQYACANTNDKIFLPSYRDIVNISYGFNSDSSNNDVARTRLTSDYSRATGAGTSNNGNGYWWLRSPNDNNSTFARYIFRNGDVYYDFSVNPTEFGVVPALTIKLS